MYAACISIRTELSGIRNELITFQEPKQRRVSSFFGDSVTVAKLIASTFNLKSILRSCKIARESHATHKNLIVLERNPLNVWHLLDPCNVWLQTDFRRNCFYLNCQKECKYWKCYRIRKLLELLHGWDNVPLGDHARRQKVAQYCTIFTAFAAFAYK